MHKYASIAHKELNQIVLGCNWDQPKRESKQIATLGVVEGMPNCGNVHMHLAFFSRTEIFLDDLKEAFWKLSSKNLAYEFWVAPVQPAKMHDYNRYMFKGFYGPDTRDMSDRVFISQAFVHLHC